MSPLSVLPPIPAKRYFTIGEVSDLCGVKAHVLRYWEQEFTVLKPVKRRGNRRYYQHHEVLLIRRIRALLYDEGFTISGARNRLQDLLNEQRKVSPGFSDQEEAPPANAGETLWAEVSVDPLALDQPESLRQLRGELLNVRHLLDEALASLSDATAPGNGL